MKIHDSLMVDILGTLTEDGDMFTMPNGDVLRLRLDSDPDTSVSDDEYFGRIEMVAYRDTRYGRVPVRPAWADGSAQILRLGNGDFWWLPYRDEDGKVYSDPDTRRNLVWLLDEGYVAVGVELLRGADHYGRPIVVDAAWTGGVDLTGPYPRGVQMLREILPDLLDELAD